jgi:hypothetical protein
MDDEACRRTGRQPGCKVGRPLVLEPAYDTANEASDLWITPVEGSALPHRLHLQGSMISLRRGR